MPVTTTYQTHFAPYDDVASVVVGLAAAAVSSVHIDIYGMTYAPLVDALVAAHRRGVAVNIVADHTQAEGTAEHPALQRLVDAGIDVLIGTSSRGAIDHSKYLIVDAATVGWGSFNFSDSATRQDNTFSLTTDTGMVAQFLANWQRVHDDAAGRHPEWQLTPSGG